MDEQFEACLKVSLDFEGGLADNPADRGGLTKWGITQGTYAGYRRDVSQPPQPVALITLDEMRDIYRRNFYEPCRCFLMTPVWAMLVFDTAILCGPGRAINWMQDAVGVTVDGKLGPVTFAAMRTSRIGPRRFLDLRVEFHQKTVDNDPSQAVFIKGWLNRVDRLQDLVAKAFVIGASPLPPFAPVPAKVPATP